MKLLEIRGLHKSFKETEAVSGIDFYLNEGEILGLLGPNGAGKSTTISMVSSLMKPTKGEIDLKGESILKNPKPLRKILGVVPQDIALYPDLTGYENLKFFGRVYGLKGEELENRIFEILDLVELKDRAKEKVENYSGGMKRRMNIGAALLHKPKILIMDEPTVGIDPQSRHHILETVKKLAKEGMTIIYTSHYMEEVEFVCDRIYIMDAGKIIASGTKDELKKIIATELTIEIKVDLVSDELTSKLIHHPKVKGVSTEDQTYHLVLESNGSLLGEIFHLAEEQEVSILSVNVKTPSLEDVFLHLTGKGLRN